MGAQQPVPATASGQSRLGHRETRSPHWTRHVVVVIAGIVAGYAVIAIMVALLAVS
jgi:hypothetical protein